jgi:hypothetical protein
MPEDGILYMEFQGTNQMRWVADYMKAKAGGRYSGTCVNINYTAAEMSYGNNTQCGALSIERVGGVKPDYFWDAFWDDLLFFNWHVEDFGIYSNNFTSWFHFVNLLKTNEDGERLVTNNYNTYDGYAYNQTYGFPNIGIDYLLAVFMNNAQMSVNLPNCSDSACLEWQGISNTYRANPASTTGKMVRRRRYQTAAAARRQSRQMAPTITASAMLRSLVTAPIKAQSWWHDCRCRMLTPVPAHFSAATKTG